MFRGSPLHSRNESSSPNETQIISRTLNMWESKKTVSFIRDFRLSECLWNAKHKDYKDRDKKEYTLACLADKYQCEVKDIEKKISNLRAQFRREHKKMARIRKGSSPSKCVWFAYKSLLFLAQGPEETEATENQNGRAIEDAEEISVKTEAAATSSSEETEEEWERDSFQYPNALKSKRLDPSIEVKATECLKKLTETVYNRDDFSTYGDYIAAKLRNSGRSKEEIAIAQYHIEEIVFNLVMGFYSEEQQYAETCMEPETYTTPPTHLTPQGRAAPPTHISSETQTISVASSTNMDCNN